MTGRSMRTERAGLAVPVLLAGALAGAQPSTRFELGVPLEVTLVGLTFGVRPELLFRPGDETSVSRVRLAVGVLGGRDQLFVPVSLGYRAQFRQGAVVQPLVGAGVELQHRWVNDLPLVQQFGFYAEGGVSFAASRRLDVALVLGVDLMLWGGPGIGLGPRLGVGWRF